MKNASPTRGVALVITLAMIAMLTFLVVAFLSRSVANSQIESAATGSTRADILARSACQTIIGDFKSEIVAGSTVFSTGSQMPVYVPLSPNTAVTPAVFPSKPSISRYALPTYDSTFINLVKQSTGRFYPDVSPFNTNVKPVIQSATNLNTEAFSANGRVVTKERWDNPSNTDPWGPQLLVSTTPYARFYDSKFLPHWVMVTRQGVPATQGSAFPSGWRNYSPDNPDAAIGRFAYNIYDTSGLLDVNTVGYNEMSNDPAMATALGQKGTLGLAQLSAIPAMGGSQNEQMTNAAKFAKTWRNYASGTQTNDYLAYLGFSKNGTTDLSGNRFFLAGPGSGFLKAATGASSADNRVLGRQDLLRLAIKAIGTSRPYGLNLTAVQYLTHFSRELNSPSWSPTQNAGGTAGMGGSNGIGSPPPYAYADNKNNAAVPNRFFPNVRVGGGASWRRLTGEKAVEGEPLLKYRFPLSWLALLQDAEPASPTWELTAEATVIVRALDARNKANGGPGLTGSSDKERAAWLVQRAFGLVWDASDSAPCPPGTGGHWNYVGSNPTATAIAMKIALLGDAATPPPSVTPPEPANPTPVSRDNREPNFFELLKSGILSGSLGNASDFESLCTSIGEDCNPDNQIMQIGANIIDQADPDSYPTKILFGYKFDNPPRIQTARAPLYAAGNAPQRLAEGKLISGVEDLPYIYTFLSTPYRLPEGQKDLNQGLPGPDPLHVDVKVQNAKRDMLDGWMQFVMWKPHQPPVTATTTAMKFRIVFNTTKLTLWFNKDLTSFGGRDFYEGTDTEPALTSATVSFDDSADFRAPTLLGGMGNTTLHNFTASQPEGRGSTGDATPVPLPRGMWMGEMYRPERDLNDANYKQAPYPIHTEFRCNADATIDLQYQDAAGAWRTYQRYDHFAGGTGTMPYGGRYQYGYSDDISSLKSMIGNSTGGDWLTPPAYRHLDVSTIAISAIDPRSHRYGLLAHYRDYGPSNQKPSMVPDVNWNYYLKQGWAPSGVNPYSMIMGPSSTDGRFVPSWTGGPRDNPWDEHNKYNPIQDPTSFWVDDMTTNPSSQVVPSPAPQYYKDLDLVQRRGDGDSVNIVRPIQVLNANTRDLGRVLNRPFRSVGELGYVFRDEPYKSLNLFTANSADSALLDLFSVNEQPVVVAGKANLNTQIPEVLAAVISGAAREEQSTTSTISAADALTIAQKLVANTTTYAGANTNTGPLLNPAEIANRLATILPINSGDPNTTIKARREVVGRALAGSGQTRTWNFLVDLIAQSGRYNPAATQVSQFTVEGERRYWLHLAIDRYTGQVVDQQLESVME